MDRTSASEKWKTYEGVAHYLIGQLAERFGLGKVEGKQIIAGESGTNWEIDAKGIKSHGEGFVIIECRRHTKSGLTQEAVGAIAYRVEDTGAEGGIIVSPLDLQKGAKKVAEHEGIVHVTLDPNSTTTDYMLKFLNQIFIGVSDRATARDKVNIQKIEGGKIIKEFDIE